MLLSANGENPKPCVLSEGISKARVYPPIGPGSPLISVSSILWSNSIVPHTMDVFHDDRVMKKPRSAGHYPNIQKYRQPVFQ